MGAPPYPTTWRLVRPYSAIPGNFASRLIIVATSTAWLTRSRATASQKACGLNFGMPTWQAPPPEPAAGRPQLHLLGLRGQEQGQSLPGAKAVAMECAGAAPLPGAKRATGRALPGGRRRGAPGIVSGSPFERMGVHHSGNSSH